MKVWEEKRPPSPWPSPPGEGITFARSRLFEGPLDQSSACFTKGAENDSPSPGGEGRGEGGFGTNIFLRAVKTDILFAEN
jgi:hypothetical protein